MDVDQPKPRDYKYPDFRAEQDECVQFLREFRDKDGEKKYLDMLQKVANRELKIVEIALDDLDTYEHGGQLVTNVIRNTRRYVTLFSNAIDAVMPDSNIELDSSDVLDVLRSQRENNVANTGDDVRDAFPRELMRRFELHFRPLSSSKPVPLREIRSKYVGSLVTVKGIVTRMSEVRPLMRVATYVCDVCGYEIYQEVDAKEYMPLFECQSAVCKANQTTKAGKLYPQTRGSKLLKYQDLKLQELPGEVPVGNIPRSLSVTVKGELTRKCVPGDIVTLTGIFLVVRHTGFRAMYAGLTTDTYLDVVHVEQHKKTYTDLAISEELMARVEDSRSDADIYTKLAKSIAPEIYGLEDVKRALLLLLVGGQTRVMNDGMKIRGDINILLMGDPGVAKSQLLKHIASVAPRGVYTTGKGSSGVGLTAAVIRDPLTGEMTLEGGALVLADMMEEGDRTAIHEVMEQQSVSIAKAGITTTLNARTSVLAAANPVFQRYNPELTPEANIGLPTALLSRFDLTFILRDLPNDTNDLALARHVTTVHRTQKPPALTFEPFDQAFLRAYVTRARTYDPYIPKDLTDFIVGTYVQMRGENDKAGDKNRTRFCTARSLLSILRLAQAVARLRFADSVDEADVQEAVRLLFITKQHVWDSMDEEKEARKGKGKSRAASDYITAIFSIIKSMGDRDRQKGIKASDLEKRIKMQGYSKQQLDACVDQYQNLGILSVESSRGVIHLT